MEVVKQETVRANEGGVQVLFQLGPSGQLRITVIGDGLPDVYYMSATISNWRWKRILENFNPEPK